MRRFFVITAMFCGLTFLVVTGTWASGTHSLGVGAHYWTAVKDINVNDVDENGFSVIGSYQNHMSSFFTFELDLEVFGEGYAGAGATVLSPQAYLLFGKTLYGGAGVGINHSDDSYSDPFFALRAGVDLELLPQIHLDINGNYRFETWDFERLEKDVNTGNVTLGALIRFGF